jgi:antirestriction protein ArdC
MQRRQIDHRGNRTILSAAAHAQRAVSYLHDLQPKPAEIDQAA